MELAPLTQLPVIRRMREISQAELGHQAGLLQQYISALERGLRPADWNHVLRLAAVLGVEPEVLAATNIQIDCSSMTKNIAVRVVA